MKKVVCISVPFILSEYHITAAKESIRSLRASLLESSSLYLIGVANQLRPGDQNKLEGLYDELICNDQNILARAWNRGIARARDLGASHIMIHNLDISMHPQALQRLTNAVDSHTDIQLFSPCEWHTRNTLTQARLESGLLPAAHLSCFMIRSDFTERLGEFDELFAPAYQEDNDMFYRMRLLGMQYARVKDSLMFHTEGGTLRGCLTIREMSGEDRVVMVKAILNAIKQNDRRYAEKWGGSPTQETFRTPFNKQIDLRTTKQREYP